MKMPKISVIVPSYNSQDYIQRCVTSILQQTFSDYEIVIVDDGSTDNSVKMVDDIAAKHSCIKVVHQQNRGLAEARKTGIHASDGEYIVHVDSDDWLPKDSLETLYLRCTENNLDYCAGVPYVYFSKENIAISKHNETGIFNKENFTTRLLKTDGNLPSWGCISRRSIWHDDVFPPADTRLPNEDLPINIGLSKYINRAGVFNDMIVYYYYLNPNSLTSTGALFQQNRWKSFFKHLRQTLIAQDAMTDQREHLIRILEIDRLSFNISKLDNHDEWIKAVYKYDTTGFSAKYKILHFLIKYPSICHKSIRTYQTIKGLLKSEYRSPFKKSEKH